MESLDLREDSARARLFVGGMIGVVIAQALRLTLDLEWNQVNIALISLFGLVTGVVLVFSIMGLYDRMRER